MPEFLISESFFWVSQPIRKKIQADISHTCPNVDYLFDSSQLRAKLLGNGI